MINSNKKIKKEFSEVEINGEKYLKKGEEIKLSDYAVIDPCSCIGLFPFIKRDDGEIKEIDCSLGFFKLHECPKMKINFSFDMDDRVLEIEGTRYALDFIEQTQKMAKVWFEGTPKVFLVFDKEKEEFVKDMPLMLIYGGKMCFMIAPRVES